MLWMMWWMTARTGQIIAERNKMTLQTEKICSAALFSNVFGRVDKYLLFPYNKVIPGSKGHAVHACMKKHDFGTRKT